MKRNYLAAIGLMVVLGFAFLTKALLFLHPTAGDEAFIFHVRFQNVDKIGAGTRVTFAGKPVGEVKRVDLLQEAFAPRTKANELIYPYELVIAIDSSVHLYKSDDISVKTAGLMGEHFIAIIPRPLPKDSERTPIDPKDVLYASQAGSVEETLGEISHVAKTADQTLETLLTLIERHEEGLFKTTEAIRKAAEQLEIFLRTINEGDGSLSKILKEHTLYDDLSSTVQNADQIFSDIHSYGLLFHLNREWQRELYRKKSEQELRNVGHALRTLTQSASSLKETLKAGTLSKDKDQQKKVQARVKSLEEDVESLQKIVKELDL